jgi:hypothetical protein
MSQSETGLSVECQQNRHREQCSSQTSCVCTCHDPLRPKINPDKEPAPVSVDRVSNVT